MKVARITVCLGARAAITGGGTATRLTPLRWTDAGAAKTTVRGGTTTTAAVDRASARSHNGKSFLVACPVQGSPQTQIRR